MKIVLYLAVIILSASASWASQGSQVKEGNSLFGQQKWNEAIDHYQNALKDGKHADIVQYNLGTVLYKKGDYDQAIEYLEKSAVTKDKDLNSKINYNLGNAFFQKGRSLEEANIEEAIKSMQQSLGNYEKTLKLDPKDEDALFNRKIVEEEIERLQKKKQQQEQKQNKQDQQQQNQQDKKDQSKSQDQKQDQDKGKPEDPQEDGKEEQQSPDKKQDQQSLQQKQGQTGEERKEELKKKQAQEILNDYERQEAPKGLLNFIKREQGESHVDKDW